MAWREFRHGKRKKFETQQFECNLEDNLFQLHNELENFIYEPRPYSSFFIHDPKLRHIHKAAISDRVLHQAIFRILYPVFDRGFIYDSYSSRINKGTHAAVRRLDGSLRNASKNYRRPTFALKFDISKFFDSVDHRVLLALIKLRIKDSKAIWLIEKIVKGFRETTGKGLPLGNVTSQIFANIYLNELDQFLKRRLKIKYYIRYCDDSVIVSDDKNYLISLIPKIYSFLDEVLSLKLHKNKTVIRKYSSGVDFLGYVLRPYHRVLRTKTKNRVLRKANIKNLQSYLGVLRHCAGNKIKSQLLSIIK